MMQKIDLVSTNPPSLQVKMDFVKLLTKYMVGQACIAECLEFQRSAKMQIHVIPRNGDAEAGRKVFSLDPHFVFHHGNAFETPEGQIVVESVAWRSVDFSFSLDTLDKGYYGDKAGYDGGQRSELYRYTLDLKTGAPVLTRAADPQPGPGLPARTFAATLTALLCRPSTGAARRQELARRPCEFPTVNPRVVGKPHRFIFTPGSAVDHPVLWGPNQVLLKFSHAEAGGTAGAKPTSEVRSWFSAFRRRYIHRSCSQLH